ncbi:MAG: class II aldolase/adducin family protein [Armatimonadota bacterium]|nr:class II aldolase/adducin family protein [Armatimonadota bacterium]MDR5676874.1 class II aldolase/adducin family protein [Armatimonadota bacterium]MDR5689425.1 class II aldolase/adducin family protein [Armatimonadota bacterium]MDR7389125.1 class II aldolase/adducin family protein [Armatimonadota bacterium]MDR7391631.1 class II aldolase/adducin family protein [Armatimonadota bacterium]
MGSEDRWAQEGAELRERVAVACRVLAMEGHTDITQGHVSARHPGTPYYWIKASGLGLDEVTADDVVLVDLDGNKVWGSGRPHTELPIHAEIYRARSDVMAVVHTHPPYATALAASHVPLRPVSHEGTLFWPEVPRYTFTTDLVHTREQGEALARALGSARACLMRNHGIVTVGSSVEEAALFALQLERAAKLQILAACLGPYEWTPEAEVAQKAAHLHSPRQLERNWGYYVRKLQRWERGWVHPALSG